MSKWNDQLKFTSKYRLSKMLNRVMGRVIFKDYEKHRAPVATGVTFWRKIFKHEIHTIFLTVRFNFEADWVIFALIGLYAD